MCRYSDYREPPGSDKAYERTYLYWYILAARLAFIVLFENFVAVVMIVVRWGIPDMSTKLRDQIRREAYITNEIIIKQEALRAKMSSIMGSMREPGIEEPLAGIERMDELMKDNLSSSQLDLAIHGPDDRIMPGHAKRRKDYSNISSSFLECEKNGGQNRMNMDGKSTGPNQTNDNDVETSKL